MVLPPLKKDPQSWGRKLSTSRAAMTYSLLLKKDPQSWGRKRCRTLYNGGIQVIKKRSPIMGTKRTITTGGPIHQRDN